MLIFKTMIKLIIFLFLTPPNTTNINLWCNHYELNHIDIVIKQAILETGHFTSYNCTKRNNLFGLTKSNGGYFSFNHYSKSILSYKTKIQYRYKWGNYYDFLNRIGYATAENYIETLKQINI